MEDDGGSPERCAERQMIGKVNQIAWAVQIKSQVDAEFDRVRKVLEHEQAGYFIRDWQELGNKVSRMIVGDPRIVT